MALWEVHCGETITQVEAPNWLIAVGRSLKTFGMPTDAMSRFVCELHSGGVAQVRDSHTGTVMWARANEPDAAGTSGEDAPPLVMPVPMLMPVLAGPEPNFDELTDPGRYVAPRDLSAALDSACTRIEAARNAHVACEEAVSALTDLVPAESSAILLFERSDDVMTFVVARGPHSDGVLGVEVPKDKGIAGYVATTGNSIIVLDAQTNPRHYDDVDKKVGYTTQDMLAVAIPTPKGRVLGVLELLNPAKTFVPWNLEAACGVAEVLGARLAR